MKNTLANLGNIPVTSSVIASLYPQLKAKNKKIETLEKAGEIIRLKKGLFIVNPKKSGITLSTELIANHLYTPSYVSMQSALRFYGLIPESVHTCQSMTVKYPRSFDTPLGRFTYHTVSRDSFAIGVTRMVSGQAAFIIATPEKALCDLIANSNGVNLRYLKETEEYLEYDIRLDMEEFYRMNPEIFRQYAEKGKKANSIKTVLKLLEQ